MAKYTENLPRQLLDILTDADSNFSTEDASKILMLINELDIQDYISNEILQCSDVDMSAYFEILKSLKYIKKFKKAREDSEETPKIIPETPVIDVKEEESDNEIQE